MPEAPFSWHGEHLAIDLGAARALFTTRRGGSSQGPYASLNLGRWTDDDPAAVGRNRALAASLSGGRLAFGRQVHGSDVIAVNTVPEADGEPLGEVDGVLTARRGVAPMVLTADCLPIVLAGGGAVAVLHAGWRGLAAGVIDRGVRALRELTGSPAPLRAAIGPGAGPCCYEVSEDVHRRFVAWGPGIRRGCRLDLKAIALAQLAGTGVQETHDSGLCTICSEPTLFFSHRRDGGVTGRQAGIAWLR